MTGGPLGDRSLGDRWILKGRGPARALHRGVAAGGLLCAGWGGAGGGSERAGQARANGRVRPAESLGARADINLRPGARY
jgi:hypothetical protein